MDALAGLIGAPRLGAGLGVGQVDEGLPGEEVVSHILDLPLDPWLVLRVGHPGRVGDQSAGLGVLQPADREPGVHRIRPGHNGLMLSGIRTLKTPPKNRQAASQPSMTA